MTEAYDQDKILGYVEGELSEDERAGFEAVLAEDHELRQLVSQMKLDREALRGLGASRAPVGLIDQVIQSHERSALLGDPAAPEPLPLTTPVSRWNFRRTLAYGAVAAVLILSFGVVFQTLIPPNMFNRGSQFAQHTPGPGEDADTSGADVPNVGSGVALLDEDSAYDRLDARTQGRKRQAGSAPVASEFKAAHATEAAEGTASNMGMGRALTAAPSADKREDEQFFADAEVQADTNADPAEEGGPGLDALAIGERAVPGTVAADEVGGDVAAGTVLAGRETVQKDTPAATDAKIGADPLPDTAVALKETPSSPNTPGSPDALSDTADQPPAMAKGPASSADESDAGRFNQEVLADAFAGYPVDAGEAPTQLVVNASSPTQAQRDIRDWALANSVVLIEEPAVETRAGMQGGLGGAVALKQDDRPGRLDRALTGTEVGAIQRGMQAREGAQVGGASGDDSGGAVGGEDRTYVLIDRAQVPVLLSYLNRAEGQRAALVAQPGDASSGSGVAVSDDARDGAAADRQSGTAADAQGTADAEADGASDRDTPKATANRLVDTESGWFRRPNKSSSNSGLTVRGLAGAPNQQVSGRQADTDASASGDAATDTATEADNSPTQPSAKDAREASSKSEVSRRAPSYFDWSRLLEPRPRAAEQPAAVNEAPRDEAATTESTSTDTPTTRVRLEIVIRQAADEGDLKNAGQGNQNTE